MATAAFLLALTHLQPDVGWLDTAEFVAGASTLGVVHPPAHPLYCLLAKLASTALPFGSVALRLSVFSALMGAAALVAASRLARQGARLLGARPGLQAVVGVTAAIAGAMSTAFLGEATRPEVYALHAALILWALERAGVAVASSRLDALRVAALIAGLGLANHHYLVVFGAPALLVAFAFAQRASGRPAVRSLAQLAALSAAALVTYAYLPLRAGTDPVINWGDPTTLARFWDVLTAKTFQASVSSASRGAPLLENVGVAMGMWGESLGLWGFATNLLAGAGLVLGTMLARRVGGVPPRFGAWLAVLCVFGGGAVLTKAIMAIDPDNPDDYGYFLSGILVMPVVGAVGLAKLAMVVARHTRPWALLVPPLALGAVSVVGLGERLHATDRTEDRAAAALARATLDPLAPDAVAFVDYFQLQFIGWYAQLVENARPDVDLIQSSFEDRRAGGVPFLDALDRRSPRLAAVTSAVRRRSGFPLTEVLALADGGTPVYFEPGFELLVPPERLATTGLLRAVVATAEARTTAAVDRWRELDYRLGTASNEARAVVDWLSFLATSLALRQGDFEQADVTVQRWGRQGRAGPPLPVATLVGELSGRLPLVDGHSAAALRDASKGLTPERLLAFEP
ncbi:MAG: DUF2723 domain-containing protein [Myxococcales bacterium]|nr:DUF2723 domain-containing protein [Myxococcales bacterium]